MSQSQGQTDFGPPAPEELEEDGQNDFMKWVEGIGEAAPPADAADGSPKVMRLPPAVAEIQFELRRMKLVGGHGSRRRKCTSTRNTLVKTSSVS